MNEAPTGLHNLTVIPRQSLLQQNIDWLSAKDIWLAEAGAGTKKKKRSFFPDGTADRFCCFNVEVSAQQLILGKQILNVALSQRSLGQDRDYSSTASQTVDLTRQWTCLPACRVE